MKANHEVDADRRVLAAGILARERHSLYLTDTELLALIGQALNPRCSFCGMPDYYGNRGRVYDGSDIAPGMWVSAAAFHVSCEQETRAGGLD